MKKGTKNEASVVKSLLCEPYIHDIWDVGLVAMRHYPFIGVSADGVVDCCPPSSDNRTIATLEIKTKIAEQLKRLAETVAHRHGHYFECCVGDSIWFQAVPREYRGQVIQQALVFGVSHAMFVVASVTRIFYSVLIRVSTSQRDMYLQSLLRYRHLLDWAHNDSAVR